MPHAYFKVRDNWASQTHDPIEGNYLMVTKTVVVRCTRITAGQIARTSQVSSRIMNVIVGQFSRDSLHLTHRIVGTTAITPLFQLIDEVDITLIANHGIEGRRTTTGITVARLTRGRTRAFATQAVREAVVTRWATVFHQCTALIVQTDRHLTSRFHGLQIGTLEIDFPGGQISGYVTAILLRKTFGVRIHHEHGRIHPLIGREIFKLLQQKREELPGNTRRPHVIIT